MGLQRPFVQPLDGRSTTIARDAAEVRCGVDGTLEGATLSDHGYVIISMFFDGKIVEVGENEILHRSQAQPNPGRVSMLDGVQFQSESEYKDMCTDRASNGYNSGMGEIF